MIGWAWTCYCMLYLLAYFGHVQSLRSLVFELRPFALVLCQVSHMIDFVQAHSFGGRVVVIWLWVMWTFLVWTFKDDRWKRRRRKALSKVKQLAGRLVVVPVPAPAGV